MGGRGLTWGCGGAGYRLHCRLQAVGESKEPLGWGSMGMGRKQDCLEGGKRTAGAQSTV